ncbi:hypothetical protein DSL72_008802 [Monilinia vaccinii-corymbosi]|uniref:Life-span regulatory factor domain-containing protein n=1 Tax=Monilinia vaccinii-corymbosi TaxID=61207 RepID=A0A8A3PRQ3_9HELO|nr:hypothetical protein DSL72_008802 [Monilinia vaccinii-corymbosi]
MVSTSRPSAARTQTTPVLALSPKTNSEKSAEKKTHHVRRKSGKESAVVAEKRTSRPTTLHKKTTQATTKAARNKEVESQSAKDNEESFPQFCMTCEKQFTPANSAFLYCSEQCRLHDQAPTYTSRSNSHAMAPHSPPLTPFMSSTPLYSPEEPRDIVPRLSPTQSRPRSYFNSSPYSTDFSDSYQAPSTSLPTSHFYTSSQADTRSSSALASLRELATALPRTSQPQEPESPPPTALSRTSSQVWNYMPFTSKTTTPTPVPTPGNSYSNSSTGNSARRSREDLSSFGNGQTYTTLGGLGMDRPLPPRSGPGGYGHRPRSIDLVTPYTPGI